MKKILILISFCSLISTNLFSLTTASCAGDGSLTSGDSSLYNMYCASIPYYTEGNDIFLVSVGSINNFSDCNTTAPGMGSLKNQYSNYFFDVPAADLAQGSYHYFHVQAGPCSWVDNAGFKIYIDFNQDGDFEDPGENVYTSATRVSGLHTEYGFITVPLDAATGITMMRVINSTTDMSYLTPCFAYYNGETEDYRVNITPQPPCLQPFPVTTASISPYEATLAWPGSATGYEYEFGPVGFTPSGAWIPVTANQVTLTGLTPITKYDFYIRANCSGIYSDVTGPYTFTTLCAVYDLPYSQYFNTSAFPECWKEVSTFDPRWWVANSNAAGGTPYEMQGYWTYGWGVSRLISPALNTSDSNILNVSFRHLFRTYAPGITYKIQSSADGNLWTDEAWLKTSDYLVTPSEWVNTTVTHNIGDKTYVAWVLEGDFYQFWNWNVDNVSVKNGPFFITSPVNLAFGYIPFGSSSPEQSFTVSGYNLSGDTVKIAAPAGYGLSLVPGGPYTAELNFALTSSSLNTTTIYTGFTPTSDDTRFNDSIRITGGGGNYGLPVTGSSEHYYRYCTSLPESESQGDIFNVRIGTLNNTSDCLTLAPGNGSVVQKYGNYYFDVPPVDLAQGTRMDFKITIGTCNYSYPNKTAIYIDFNHDGDFSDTNEVAYVSSSVSYIPHYETGTIAIPPDAIPGATMMRIVNASATSLSYLVLHPCGTYQMGETEDYKVNIVAEPACKPPYQLSANQVLSTDATLHWSGDAPAWEYQVGITGFLPASTGTAVTDTSIHVTGLNPVTGYDYYVRASCPGGNSVWAGPFSFKTACIPVALPFSESFAGTAMPSCWSQTPELLPLWTISQTNMAGGTENELVVQHYWIDSSLTTRIITPPLNTTGAACLRLSFREFLYTYSSGSVVKIESSADGLNWTDEIWEKSAPEFPMMTGAQWIETIVTHNLGNITYVALTVTGNLLSFQNWNVDDVVIDTNPVLLPNPETLDFGYVAAGNTSTVRSFTLAGFNLAPGPVTVQAPDGFNLSLSPGGPWSSTINIEYTPPQLPATTVYAIFSPLTADSIYSGHFVCTGGGGTKNIPFTAFSEIYYGYCSSAAQYDWWGSDITRVKIGTLNNTSGCYPQAPGPGSIQNRYSNFYFSVPAPVLQAGTFPTFSVEAGYTCYYSVGMNALKIFIDFNRDSDFADPGEEVYVSPEAKYGMHTESGFIIIPVDADTGYTMMRVINSDNYNPLEIMACGSYWYGETEDYRVKIVPGPACLTPGLLTATNLTPTTATLSWSSPGTLFNIEYGQEGFVQGTGTIITGFSNPYTLNSLNNSTAYQYYVQQDCDTSGVSSWAGPFTFATACVVGPAPWSEGFSGATFPPVCWSTENGYFFWSRFQGCGGYGTSNTCAKADFYNFGYSSFSLNTKQFNMNGVHLPLLKFDYAYATRYNQPDFLEIYYSTDGGASFTLLSTMEGGQYGILNTGGSMTDVFIPADSQWATQTLSLPPGTNKVKFNAVCRYGNNLYIDNVRIEATPVPANQTIQGTLTGTGCYNATQVLTVGGSAPFVVEPGGSATFIAGQKISYLPGTKVKQGGYMHGYITSDNTWCGDPIPPVNMKFTEWENQEEKESGSEMSFKIYPNPTTGDFYIENGNHEKVNNLSVLVYDMTGTLLVRKELSGESRYKCTLRDFAKGVYMVRVSSENRLATLKIVKQ